MNRIKSLFISTFFVVFSATLAVGVARLVAGATWAGLGATVAGGVWALYFARLFLFTPDARNHPHLPVQQVTAVAGAALTPFGGDPVAAALASATVLGGLGYTWWYSRLGRAPSRLTVGARLPDFTLHEGEDPVPSAALRSALLLFYRGNWCPLCMAQIKEVAAQYRSLAERGVQVCLVSPQSAGHTASLAKRFAVPLRFLVDADNAAARALGIAHEAGLPTGLEVLGYGADTVLPTVVITDAEGVVRWTHETDNYRLRPEPEVFIEVLDGLAGPA